MPQCVAGQPLPCATLSGLPANLVGTWGLYEIRLQAGHHEQSRLLRIPLLRRRYFSVFLREDGRIFLPTARHIWDTLQSTEPHVVGMLTPGKSVQRFNRLLGAAEEAGAEHFEALSRFHLTAIEAEEERGVLAFDFRHKAIARVGLLEVRHYRQRQCEQGSGLAQRAGCCPADHAGNALAAAPANC
ncbi:MAG: hypothetical protein R3A44_30935 [Caldilineaceae bacterium]